MSNSRPQKHKPKPDRSGKPTPSEKVGKPKPKGKGPGRAAKSSGSRNDRLIAQSLSSGIEELKGAADALDDKKAEWVEIRDWDEYQQEFNQKNQWPILSDALNPTPPKEEIVVVPQPEVAQAVTPQVVAVLENKPAELKSKSEGLKFTDCVTAHFVAFEYTDKSLKSALGNILRWRMISKDSNTIAQNVKTIHAVYASRQLRMSWYAKLKGNLRDWTYSIDPIKLGLRVVGWVVATCLMTRLLGGKRIPFTNTRIPTGISVLRTVIGSTGVIGIVMWAIKQLRGQSQLQCSNQPLLPTYCTRTSLNVAKHVIDDGARLKLKVGVKETYRCQASHVKIGFTIGRPYIWCPRNCLHNEVNAAVTRQLQPRIPVSNAGGKMLHRAEKIVTRNIPVVNIDVPKDEWLDLFLNKYPAARREAIKLTLSQDTYVTPKVAGFPKIEVMTGKTLDKRKVRFISGFTEGYLAETGPEYYLWQKALIKQLWSDSLVRNNQRFVYTGGLLGDEIGDWFTSQTSHGHTLLLLDFSKFDSRNKEQVLHRLYSFYRQHLSAELMHWLDGSFNKEGKTSHGLMFSVIATVASGRIDTSLGNTLIVFMLATAILGLLDPKYLDDFWVSALGDDNNIALPEFNHTIEQVNEASRELGHDADGLIIRPGDYHLMEYCSQRLWEYQPGQYVLGPKPGRLLAKTFVTHRHVPDAFMEAHMSGVMEGFKMYSWIPVFGKFFEQWFVRHTKPGKLFYSSKEEHRVTLKTELVVDVSIVNDQFFAIYGFYPEQLNSVIEEMEFKIGDCYRHPLLDIMLEKDGISYDYSLPDYIEYVKEQSLSVFSGTTLNELHVPVED